MTLINALTKHQLVFRATPRRVPHLSPLPHYWLFLLVFLIAKVLEAV